MNIRTLFENKAMKWNDKGKDIQMLAKKIIVNMYNTHILISEEESNFNYWN